MLERLLFDTPLKGRELPTFVSSFELLQVTNLSLFLLFDPLFLGLRYLGGKLEFARVDSILIFHIN